MSYSLLEEVRKNQRTMDVRARIAWREWVAELAPWRWFVTLTFTLPDGQRRGYDKRGVAYAWARWRGFYDEVGRTQSLRLRAVAVVERHVAGSTHVHGIVAEGRGARPLTEEDRSYAQAWASRHGGFARVEDVREATAVADYVVKYVLKDGDQVPNESNHA